MSDDSSLVLVVDLESDCTTLVYLSYQVHYTVLLTHTGFIFCHEGADRLHFTNSPSWWHCCSNRVLIPVMLSVGVGTSLDVIRTCASSSLNFVDSLDVIQSKECKFSTGNRHFSLLTHLMKVAC